MKQTCMIFLIPAIVVFTNCGDNLAATNEKQSADNGVATATKNPASTSTTSVDGIVGTWKLIMEAFDENFNEKLDDEERKKGMKVSNPESATNFQMQYNANGTCLMERIYKGSYKISEEGDKKILFVDLEEMEIEGRHFRAARNKYHIKSMTSSELLLLREISGVAYAFKLLKKV